MTTQSILENCFHDATRKDGLIDFTKKIRTDQNDMSGKYSLKQKDLNRLFSDAVWKDCETRSGHRKLKNLVTSVVIEYANHDNKAGIDPGAALDVLESAQKHLNILGNQIFAPNEQTKYDWKHEPDYSSSEKRLNALKKN